MIIAAVTDTCHLPASSTHLSAPITRCIKLQNSLSHYYLTSVIFLTQEENRCTIACSVIDLLYAQDSIKISVASRNIVDSKVHCRRDDTVIKYKGIMMHASLPQSPKTASSIFDAIKDGDWEGLLALYATSAYDAVQAAEFARQGGVGFHRQHSSPPSLMAAMAGPRKGVFRDEKKMEGSHHLTSCHQSYKSSPATSFSSSSAIHELEFIVREIIGAEIFDGHQGSTSEASHGGQHERTPKQTPQTGQPNKKTRQHSPSRKSPPGLSALDHLLFHNHTSSPSSRSEKEMDWEKVMRDSASILSNCRPSPSFMVTRQEKNRRGDSKSDTGALKSMEGVTHHAQEEDRKKSSTPLFEGNVANATPGDLIDGGTGSGTAQHLACLLDSPFALAMLIVLGVNVEARHTAFRRLAVHEAACSDSPHCLSLLMNVGTRFSMELFRDTAAVAASPVAFASACGQPSSAHSFQSSTSFAAAPVTGFDSFDPISKSLSSKTEERISQRKPGKKKLNPFSGWHKGKTSGNGASILKKSSFDECEKVAEFTSFPFALKVMWDAAKFLSSGEMNEIDAAHYVLDRVKVSKRAMVILALQCPHLPSNKMQGEDQEASQSSPFASIPGSSSASDGMGMGGLGAAGLLVHQLFQPNHRDMQSSFIKHMVDGHGNTPLHWAAFKNSVRAMDVLLLYNADVNHRAQPSGWTPLHDAAYSDAADAVARLIVAGATVDTRSHSGATPLCFAAQEDAPNATRMLLKAGADPSMRCLGNSPGIHIRANNADNNHFHSRFSGYTPLHYCAHYNAAKAAGVLLHESNRHHHLLAVNLLEIPDLNEKLPIHVAVARGSSQVLRELLHSGARVETSSYHPPPTPRARAVVAELDDAHMGETAPVAIPRDDVTNDEADTSALSTSPSIITPVSSPLLRAMIPSQPITSSKPWNCLSQKSIDACKHLIEEVEMNWTPERHALFIPADRVSVVEVLRVGKRLEQVGRGIFLDLWPHVLSFCGRGWFEPVEEEELERKGSAKEQGYDNEEEMSMQCSISSSESSEEDREEFTQFQLDDGTNS
mmetsp:Transcript_31810/g.66870  ORF Transcript_31810/g.66870 Transcript_31810/m.66870 type:complete len:1053 (+) Transcript_31810:42-3200(+)